jgi:hypothetical protein
VAARREIADAWLELTRRRADWSQRFATLLREGDARRAPVAPHAPVAGDDRFGGLTLIDEDTIAREIDGARVLQLIAPRLEQPLAELDALMSSALGLAAVQPESNPLRPQAFAHALRQLMQPVSDPAWPRLWAQHMAPALAGEIHALYGEVLKVLRAARLTEATYRVLPTTSTAVKPAPQPAPPAPVFGAAGGGAGGGAGSGLPTAPTGTGATGSGERGVLGNSGSLGGASWADLSSYEMADELFQNFLFSRTPPSTQALAPAFYARVDARQAAVASGEETYEPYDADTVARQRALPPVEREARRVATVRELDQAIWGRWAAARERAQHRNRLKKEARQVGQVLGLEVVRKLVDQVARDPRLLAPVREAVVALEPALAKLALVAPRFFAQEDHSGRRLVERVAERSFRYNDEFASDFQEFFDDVRTTFRALNEQRVSDPAPFARALQELEERWTGEDAVARRGSQVAVDAMHFAEARQAEAAQIAWSMSQRADLDELPAVVQDFLFGPWSLVIAHSRLTGAQGEADPGGWNAVVTDLVWSAKSQQTLRDPQRLFTTVPGMLEKVRTGLKLVGQEPAQQESFFQALEKLHSPVLKLRAHTRHASHAMPPAPDLDPALLSTERKKPSASAGAPWLTPGELQAAGFVDERASAPAPLEEGDAHDDVDTVIAALQQGCWVDLFANDRWRRANLTWVNSRATLFMFVSHAGQPHTMTRRSLERVVREQHLRLVEAGAVVPRALEALSRHAEPAAPARRGVRAHEERIAA